MTKKKSAQAESPQPKKTRTTKVKASKKAADAPGRTEALLGKQFTHRKRAEWGTGTVVDGEENALVLAWSDGTQRRTARSYLDQLVEVP